MATTGLITKGYLNQSIITRGYLGGINAALRGIVLDFKASFMNVIGFKASENA